VDENVKIGKLNLPTITFSVLLSCVFSIALIKAFEPQNHFLHTVIYFSCPIASLLGLLTLVWCFVERKQYSGVNNRYFRQAVLLGISGLTSPVWIIIVLVLLFGFNR